MSDSSSRGSWAGGHTVDITPEAPFVWGGPQLTRNPVEESALLAHAVVFTDGNDIAAVVSCDLPMIARPYALAYRELASIRSGIPASRIFIAANHVHAAPWVSPGFLINGPAPDPIYAEFLGDRIAVAVAEAARKLGPGRFAAGVCENVGASFNRRYLRPDGTAEMVFSTGRDPAWPPAGPADDQMAWILFEGNDGEPVALVTSFSAHNHVVSGSPVPGRPANPYWHRDFGGRFGDSVRELVRSGIPTAYLAGACGNTSWQDPAAPPPVDGSKAAWRIGRSMASKWLAASNRVERRPIRNVRTAARVLEIQDRPFAESRPCDDRCRGPEDAAIEFDRRRYSREGEALAARGDRGSCVAEMGAIAIDDVAISTNPAELFVEFGLEIKSRSPMATTLISELTNGYVGYVPTPEAFDQGGYETHRSIFTSRLNKGAGPAITEASLEALREVAAR